MKTIFLAHSSLVAFFTADEINFQTGDLLFLGKDKKGNEHYFLGVGSEAEIIKIAWKDLCRIAGKGINKEIELIDVSFMESFLLKQFWIFARFKFLRKAIFCVAARIYDYKWCLMKPG